MFRASYFFITRYIGQRLGSCMDQGMFTLSGAPITRIVLFANACGFCPHKDLVDL